MTYNNPNINGSTWSKLNILETLRKEILSLFVLPMMWCEPLQLTVY